MQRCGWVNQDPLYIAYHDQEWGVPINDDRRLFEFLILEGAQAGLSWYTILKKREHYRQVFDGFDFDTVASYDEQKVSALLSDPGIVRNRLKIAATIGNAQSLLRVRDEFGSFSQYIWGFVDGRPIMNHWRTLADVPVSTALSDRISKDMKKRGFRFVGNTIIYSYMQAVGMVMDHLQTCFRYEELVIQSQ